MHVLAASPHSRDDSGVEFVPLEDLLRRSDVVSLHVALNAQTRHLLNEDRLALMKPTAYVVNTARGAAIDEPALIRVLRDGRIAGAGLDVFEVEPPAPDNPLLHMDNVVATPHALGHTVESSARMGQAAQEGLLDLLAGRVPGYALNPSAARRLLTA
jgi:phosphoglycerate dehydrogenase-like enzyme